MLLLMTLIQTNDLSISKVVVGETEYNTGVEITMPSGALLTVESDGSTTYNPNGQFDAFYSFRFSKKIALLIPLEMVEAIQILLL